MTLHHEGVYTKYTLIFIDKDSIVSNDSLKFQKIVNYRLTTTMTQRSMTFSSEKQWRASLKLLYRDTIEPNAPAASSLAAWPISSAANLSKLPQETGVKMVQPKHTNSGPSEENDTILLSKCQISTPLAYYATHDTMPPPCQGSCGSECV